MKVLDVLDLRAAINGNRRRQSFVEKFALVITQDHDGLGGGFLELFAEHFHRAAALLETLAADLDGDLIGKSRCALF